MCKKEPKMDYQQILQEQMKETLDADAFDALTKQVAEYSGGMAEDFSLDSIVESALNGEALFDSQVLIENLKSLFLYEVRSALLLGVQILTVCIAIGLLQSLGTSFGKKSLSSIGQLVCTMVIIGIAVSSFRLIYTLSLDTVSTMVNTMAPRAPTRRCPKPPAAAPAGSIPPDPPRPPSALCTHPASTHFALS